jgi:lipopolysaccharide transport system permease protein
MVTETQTEQTVETEAVAGAPAFDYPVTVIEPSKGWINLRLKELWEYRELLYFLTWREVKVRYKQTAIGVAWAVLQPLLSMLVFSLFFGRLAKMPSDGVPYPLFTLAGLIPWMFFSNGLTQSGNSLVSNANLIRKVYFPRLAIPFSAIASGSIDFAVSFVLLILMMPFYGLWPGWRIAWLPAFVLLATVSSMGMGLWLSALNVEYRDVRYVIPFLTQFWMFATPVVYPSTLLHEPWRTIYGLNPMAGAVDGFRWALLGTKTAPGGICAVSAAVAVVILVSGALYFRRMEKTFADVV